MRMVEGSNHDPKSKLDHHQSIGQHGKLPRTTQTERKINHHTQVGRHNELEKENSMKHKMPTFLLFQPKMMCVRASFLASS